MIARVSKLVRVAGHHVHISPHRKFADLECAARVLIHPGSIGPCGQLVAVI